jgi:hypothetical protein
VLSSRDSGFEIAIDNLTFLFDFIENGGGPASITEPVDGTTLRMTLTNMNNPLGTSLDFENIATVNGRHISITMYVHANDNAPIRRMITYSITAPEVV